MVTRLIATGQWLALILAAYFMARCIITFVAGVRYIGSTEETLDILQGKVYVFRWHRHLFYSAMMLAAWYILHG